jgi:hypothetical protein
MSALLATLLRWLTSHGEATVLIMSNPVPCPPLATIKPETERDGLGRAETVWNEHACLKRRFEARG